MNAKKFTTLVLSLLGLALAAIAALVIIVDPLFHYHAPLSFLEYKIDNALYQNNGILRNFDYDAVIVGTSMSQNFKTSQAEELFGYDFVKVPLAGANYVETDEILSQAFESDNDVQFVIRNIDYSWMDDTENTRYYAGIWPEYLYDDNIFNDISYLFSRDVLIRILRDVFLYTWQGNETTTLDEYNNWDEGTLYGAEYFLFEDARVEIAEETPTLTEEDAAIISQHAYENFVQVAIDNPDTTFYLFYPPYSVAYWDILDRTQKIDVIIDAKILITEELFKADNIRVFSFDTAREIVTNLDLYRDYAHYNGETNEFILDALSQELYEITEENYLEVIEADREFYLNYDYDAMYAAVE
ncbi:MAG: hypothetical protein R3Y06_04675 [Faecalibacterium sp.]